MENKLYELTRQAELIRSQAANPNKFTWPDEFKRSIVNLIKYDKLNYRDISRQTGIAESTLYGWINGKPKVKIKNTFKPVAVKKETSNKLTLSWQSGLTIDGLTFSQIEQLLKQGLL